MTTANDAAQTRSIFNAAGRGIATGIEMVARGGANTIASIGYFSISLFVLDGVMALSQNTDSSFISKHYFSLNPCNQYHPIVMNTEQAARFYLLKDRRACELYQGKEYQDLNNIVKGQIALIPLIFGVSCVAHNFLNGIANLASDYRTWLKA